MSEHPEVGMRAEDEEIREEPGRREQQETWPRSRAEGLECRAEEEPAIPPCIASCRTTCDPPKPSAISLQAIWSPRACKDGGGS